MAKRKTGVVAIFVDHHNILHQAKERNISLDEAYSRILNAAKKLGKTVQIMMLLPAYQDAPEMWREINALQIKYGTIGLTFPVLRKGAFFKDTVDLGSQLWVSAFSDSFDTAIFVTGDGDFIIAANHLKNKGKNVFVWTVNFPNTSDELFITAPVTELKATEQQPVPSGNKLWRIVQKAVKGDELNQQERTELDQLIDIERRLPEIMPKETSISALKEALKRTFGRNGRATREIIEVLLALEIILCHARVVNAISCPKPSFQLQALGATLAP